MEEKTIEELQQLCVQKAILMHDAQQAVMSLCVEITEIKMELEKRLKSEKNGEKNGEES